MSTTNASPRARVEPGIWKRRNAAGHDVFEVTFRDAAGRQRRRTVSGGITAARRALSAERARRDRGESVAADPRLKFSDAAQAWWDARVVRLRPGTQSAYSSGLAHLNTPDQFGRRRLSDITATDVARYISAKQGEGLKGWTIRGHLTVLSSVFNYAARHLGYVGTNPVSLLDRVERPSNSDEKPKRILSSSELGRLLTAVEERYRLLFATGAETGGRLSEVLGLVWQDVDLAAGTITFSFQLDRAGKRQPLKTARSQRCLVVTPSLVGGLREAKLASPYSNEYDFVFSTQAGTGHDQRNISGRVLARAAKRAGLGAVEHDGATVETAPTFHSLRHSHASALIAQGWDVAQVSGRLGHSSVATTLRTYIHDFDTAGRTDEMRDRLTALYGGSIMAASDRDTPQGTLEDNGSCHPDSPAIGQVPQ